MQQGLSIAVSVAVVFVIVIALGRKFRISARYERTPRALNSWNALDKGIDPTDQESQ